MTRETWNTLSAMERSKVWPTLSASDKATLESPSWSPQLLDLEGWQVEVVTTYGETQRFIVSRSSGWMPVHIGLKRRDSLGGMACDKTYASVRKLYHVR